MILKKDDLIKESRSNMRGGRGDIELTHLVSEEILGQSSRLFNWRSSPPR
jgi:hypothetical protein